MDRKDAVIVCIEVTQTDGGAAKPKIQSRNFVCVYTIITGGIEKNGVIGRKGRSRNALRERKKGCLEDSRKGADSDEADAR